MTSANPSYRPISTLVEYALDTPNATVRDVLRADDAGLEGGGIDLSPPYQRASVWTEEQRVNLIKSALQGLPLGAVFINDRGDFVKRIVDGKQRLETFQLWFAGELRVPSAWFAADSITDGAQGQAEVAYSDLTVRVQRLFGNGVTIAAHWTRLKTVAEEEDLYLRVNYGGTPHAPQD